MDGPSKGACLDCKRRYGDEYGFPDLMVSDEVWELICPGLQGGGLLCPSCICARAYAKGIRAQAIFTSGPFEGVNMEIKTVTREDLAVAYAEGLSKEGPFDKHEYALGWLLVKFNIFSRDITPEILAQVMYEGDVTKANRPDFSHLPRDTHDKWVNLAQRTLMFLLGGDER